MSWLISKVVTHEMKLFWKFIKKQPRLSCVWKCRTFRKSGRFANFGQIQFYFQKQQPYKFRNIQRQAPLLKSFFNNWPGILLI